MYAIRLRSDYVSLSGQRYRIEILEDGYSFEYITSFQIEAADISVKGGDIFTRQASTQLDFEIVVDNLFIEGFVEDLVANDYDERKFYVRMYRLEAASNELLFKGYLESSNIKVADHSIIKFGQIFEPRGEEYTCKMTAHCGIGRMRDARIDFTQIYPGGVPPQVSLFDVFKTVFTQVGILDLYEDSDYWLYLACIHVDKSFDVFGDRTPLQHYFVQTKAFASDTGVYIKCSEAIDYILSSWNCRLCMIDGVFSIQNIHLLNYDIGLVWRHTKTNADDDTDNGTTGSIWRDNVVSWDDNELYPDAGGEYSYLPEPGLVVLKFKGSGSNNIASDVTFLNISIFSNFGQEWDLGHYFIGDRITVFELSLQNNLVTEFIWPESLGRRLWMRYEFEIKHGDKYLSGSYILIGNPNPPFPIPDILQDDTIEWTSAPSKFNLYSDNYFFGTDVFKFDIPALVTAGAITIKLIKAAFYNTRAEEDEVNAPAFFTHFDYFKVLMNTEENGTNVEYRILNNPKNAETLELSMDLGDVPDGADLKRSLLTEEEYTLFNETRTVYKITSEWNGTDKSLQEVIISEIASIREGVLKMYDGSFWDRDPRANKLKPWNRIVYRDTVYNFLTVKYDTMTDTLKGQWYELNKGDLTVPGGSVPEGYVVKGVEPKIDGIKDDNPRPPEKSRPKSAVVDDAQGDVEEYYTDVQSDSIAPVATLPDIAVFSTDEIRRMVKVNTGSNYRYDPALTSRLHFKIDNTNNTIVFKSNLRGADVDIFIKSF